MSKVFHYHPSHGVAIYDSTTSPTPDGAPLINPLANLSRLSFHSNLRYPRFIPSKIVTGSAQIPTQVEETRFSGQISLYAHGMGDVPVVFGMITSVSHSLLSGEFAHYIVAPNDTPWLGSVPVFTRKTTVAPLDKSVACTHWVALAATSTHVVMRYFGFNISGSQFNSGVTTVNYKIFVLDTTVATDNFTANPSLPLLSLTATGMQVGRGKFNTDHAYLKLGSTVHPSVIARGETCVIKGTPSVTALDEIENGWGWRFSADGKTLEYFVASSSFAADVEHVGL